MVAGANGSLVIIPVHDPHPPLVGRLRVKDLSPLSRAVMNGPAGVVPADLPVIRHRYLVEELRARLLPASFLEIPQKKAVDRQYALRQEAVVIDHRHRIGKPCQFEGSVQVLAVRPVIVKEKYRIVYFSMFFHFSSTSCVR